MSGYFLELLAGKEIDTELSTVDEESGVLEIVLMNRAEVVEIPRNEFLEVWSGRGPKGLSAYEVAVENGFVGTEAAWLDSLQGFEGSNGLSAYEVAVANGFSGTEAEWLTSLEGDPGAAGSAATIGIGTVTTGAPGSAADVDNVGTSSAAVLDFVIPAGANGLPGITDVHHGTNGATARPSVAVVYWIGTATPANALAWDLWLKENI